MQARGIRLICVLCLLVFLLTGCSPMKFSAVKKELQNTLDIGFECIDKNISDKESLFIFKDANGVEFTYRSSLKPVNFDGSTFGYTVGNKCDYAIRFITNNKEQIIKQFQASGWRFEENDNNILIHQLTINIDRYDMIEAAAELVYNLLAHNRIPIKVQSAEYTIPSIYIENSGVFSVAYDFLCNYDPDPIYEDIYNDLFQQYVSQVKNGVISNDLPATVMKQVPPNKITKFYINNRITNEATCPSSSLVSFRYDEASKIYRLDCEVNDGHSMTMGLMSFAGFLEALDIAYSYEDNVPKWENNGISYTMELLKNKDYIIVYQNGEELLQLSVENYDEFNKEFYIAPDTIQLEKMLSVNISVDIEKAVISIQTNITIP